MGNFGEIFFISYFEKIRTRVTVKFQFHIRHNNFHFLTPWLWIPQNSYMKFYIFSKNCRFLLMIQFGQHNFFIFLHFRPWDFQKSNIASDQHLILKIHLLGHPPMGIPPVRGNIRVSWWNHWRSDFRLGEKYRWK